MLRFSKENIRGCVKIVIGGEKICGFVDHNFLKDILLNAKYMAIIYKGYMDYNLYSNKSMKHSVRKDLSIVFIIYDSTRNNHHNAIAVKESSKIVIIECLHAILFYMLDHCLA